MSLSSKKKRRVVRRTSKAARETAALLMDKPTAVDFWGTFQWHFPPPPLSLPRVPELLLPIFPPPDLTYSELKHLLKKEPK